MARFDASSLPSDAIDVLRTLAPRQREVTLEDGRCCYMMRTLPYRTTSNVISGVVITFVDVTSLKDAEERRGLHAAIVDSAEQAIIGKRVDGVITSWNAAAERMFGYSASEVIGRSIFLIVPPDHEGEMRDVLAMAARGERVAPMETVRIARGGRRLDVALTIAPIRDRGGRIIGASTIANDVTPRKQALWATSCGLLRGRGCDRRGRGRATRRAS